MTFSLEPTLLKTVLYFLFRNLSTFSDLLNFALVISPDVALILMGDLLHGLLCAIVLLLGVIIGLVPQQDLTQIAVHRLQLILLYCATVLFLGIRTIDLVSRLILLLIFVGTLFVIVGVTLLSV